MRAITLWQPWAWAIVGPPNKDVENRPWKPHPSIIGEVIAIHAGMKRERITSQWPELLALLGDVPAELPQGAIVGTARVTGCIDDSSQLSIDTAPRSRWFGGPYGWLLADRRALAEPVPCKGALGLWRLPPDVERQVLAQSEAA